MKQLHELSDGELITMLLESDHSEFTAWELDKLEVLAELDRLPQIERDHAEQLAERVAGEHQLDRLSRALVHEFQRQARMEIRRLRGIHPEGGRRFLVEAAATHVAGGVQDGPLFQYLVVYLREFEEETAQRRHR